VILFWHILGDDKLECTASGMKIMDTRGRLLFQADRKEVLVGAELLRVTGIMSKANHIKKEI
jgi:hypothetical protein